MSADITPTSENPFVFKDAERKARFAKISITGPSSSGKTWSAMEVMRGLVGTKGRFGVLDAEHERAQRYADLFGGWKHLNFAPPYTPERYLLAMQAAVDAGLNGLVVDTLSHLWQGQGGILDIADADSGRGLGRWAKAKAGYSKVINFALHLPMHVIFCLRTKEGYIQRVVNGKDVIDAIGLVPVVGKDFVYEMDAAFSLGYDHKISDGSGILRFSTMYPTLKLPNGVKDLVQPGMMLTREMGAAIGTDAMLGAPVDAAFTAAEVAAREAALGGLDALRQHWRGLSAAHRNLLMPVEDELANAAQQADILIAQQQEQDVEPPAEQTQPQQSRRGPGRPRKIDGGKL